MTDRDYLWVPYDRTLIRLVEGWRFGNTLAPECAHHYYCVLMWRPPCPA